MLEIRRVNLVTSRRLQVKPVIARTGILYLAALPTFARLGRKHSETGASNGDPTWTYLHGGQNFHPEQAVVFAAKYGTFGTPHLPLDRPY